VDRASHLLTTHGIKNHLINAGGDIRTSGSRKEGKPWTVAIEDPRKKQQFPDIIHLTDGAVATSGNYEIYFDRERMFHHIVDPFTGHSPLLATSVSVVAPTVMDADALSTSVFVLDPSRGTRFVDSLPNCECFIVTKAGEKFKSQGWKSVEA
jgi:thiamine biosynthesis lipoprotein